MVMYTYWYYVYGYIIKEDIATSYITSIMTLRRDINFIVFLSPGDCDLVRYLHETGGEGVEGLVDQIDKEFISYIILEGGKICIIVHRQLYHNYDRNRYIVTTIEKSTSEYKSRKCM